MGKFFRKDYRKVPPNILRAVEEDLKKSQWEYEPLDMVINFSSAEELRQHYEAAMSVVFATKAKILEQKGGAGA